MPSFSYRKLFPTLDSEQIKELDKLKKSSEWWGTPDQSLVMAKEAASQKEREAGLQALSSFRGAKQESDAAQGRLGAFETKILDAQLKDPEAYKRSQSSPGTQIALEGLRDEAAGKQPPRPGQFGLDAQHSQVPEVKSFLRQQQTEARTAAPPQDETMRLRQALAAELADLPPDQMENITSRVMRALTLGGSAKDIGTLATGQFADLGKQQLAQEGKMEDSRFRQAGSEKIEGMKQEGDINLENLRHQHDLALKELEGGKVAKEVKGLMDLDSAFGQLKREHKSIWTGPFLGRVGRANISGPERAKFGATRAYVLKTIARAFEGARMSDIDMKFYDKMIPQDFHTDEQFDEIQKSIGGLVEWRINRFNNTGEDPGETPTTQGEIGSSIDELKSKYGVEY